MPTTDVAQWTCAVSNLGFIYIYGLDYGAPSSKQPVKDIEDAVMAGVQ